jgi:adenine/guanine phosphoribosyltransferase-like PRPP-binding protein
MEHAIWLKQVFNPVELGTISQKITTHILHSEHKIDTIAACGLSGVCVASVVSMQTGIPMTIIRKEKEKSHSHFTIEWGIP